MLRGTEQHTNSDQVACLAGEVQGVLHLVSLLPGLPSAGNARLWLPADLMFAWRQPAGSLAAVSNGGPTSASTAKLSL